MMYALIRDVHDMPETRNQSQIREFLANDPRWSVYAVGDLDPKLFPDTRWFIAGEALALLYTAFEAPVLFTMGSGVDLQRVLQEVYQKDTAKQYHLSVRADALDLLKTKHVIHAEELMQRMVLDRSNDDLQMSRDANAVAVARLTLDDVPALKRLFSDGDAAGEAPDFFSESMVANGVFIGIREHNELVASAGTHLVSEAESVAAVGCVYTKRSHRGKGLSRLVTGAVVDELLKKHMRVIALNVKKSNAAAISVYERLGFKTHCPFYEGVAERLSAPAEHPSATRSLK